MSQKAHLLIVDDEANTLASLSRAFRLAGHEATVCDNAAKALELARSQSFDLIISDVVMPGKDGLSLLEDLKAQGVSTPVVMMSGQAHIDMAVRATRLGALDFLEKPISTEKLLLTVENALKLQRLESENRQLRQRLGKHEIVWTGETMKKLMAQIERVAASETRVCILGETGTGKELVARTLHERSPRASGPFVTLNCAAVPAELIESELFGHEKGSFTGAAGRHVGKFEQAERGTQHFAEQVCAQNNWKPLPFTPEAIEELKGNSWPGNVRELRNVVERLILLATGPEVTEDTVDQALPHTLTTAPSLAGSGTLAERAQAFEREVILAELKRHQFHVTNAAKALGLERSHLYKKAEQLGIDLRSLRHESSDGGGTT